MLKGNIRSNGLKYVLPNAISIRQFESLGIGCIRKEVFGPATACSNQVIKVLTSASSRKFSCHIPLWSYDIVFPSTAVVFYELLMILIARRGDDILLGELLRVIVVEHGHTTMLSKLFQEFHYMSMLIFSVPTSVRVFSLFSRFGYLLPVPYVSNSCMMPVGILRGTPILVEVLLFSLGFLMRYLKNLAPQWVAWIKAGEIKPLMCYPFN
ncbi:uncharacterized protein LOC113276416 isoform X2 [Papaver somniferum]|uniref:uncharacterized protein LOC113276416 isoform X2 n=1 Tax=Papaver somniferum TaxID=3469 RepID=UPI000E702EB1|nr:uncharacterized protein LOC113276416 isoform X2 [Papaver somniferum]